MVVRCDEGRSLGGARVQALVVAQLRAPHGVVVVSLTRGRPRRRGRRLERLLKARMVDGAQVVLGPGQEVGDRGLPVATSASISGVWGGGSSTRVPVHCPPCRLSSARDEDGSRSSTPDLWRRKKLRIAAQAHFFPLLVGAESDERDNNGIRRFKMRTGRTHPTTLSFLCCSCAAGRLRR